MPEHIRDLKVETLPAKDLLPSKRNPRTHSPGQLQQIAKSIVTFGWTNPILIDGNRTVLAGHGRLAAARMLNIEMVPVIRIEHMTEAQKRAYVIADNKLAENAGWDRELLVLELQSLVEVDFVLEVIGFETAEIDVLFGDLGGEEAGESDEIPSASDVTVVGKPGDLWQLGRHRLLCADATDSGAYHQLLGDQRADIVFTDPPYNVRINGHVSGLGANRHQEFAMASGEMSEAEFISFLESSLRPIAAASRDGSIHFICMDWRNLYELLAALAPGMSSSWSFAKAPPPTSIMSSSANTAAIERMSGPMPA